MGGEGVEDLHPSHSFLLLLSLLLACRPAGWDSPSLASGAPGASSQGSCQSPFHRLYQARVMTPELPKTHTSAIHYPFPWNLISIHRPALQVVTIPEALYYSLCFSQYCK